MTEKDYYRLCLSIRKNDSFNFNFYDFEDLTSALKIAKLIDEIEDYYKFKIWKTNEIDVEIIWLRDLLNENNEIENVDGGGHYYFKQYLNENFYNEKALKFYKENYKNYVQQTLRREKIYK